MIRAAYRSILAGGPSRFGSRLRAWDGLAFRLSVCIASAMLIGAGLDFSLTHLAGPLSQPSFAQSGLPLTAAELVRVLETAPAAERPSLAGAASTPAFHIDWYPVQPLRPPAVAALRRTKLDRILQQALRKRELPNRALLFRGDAPAAFEPGLRTFGRGSPQAYFLLFQLRDGSWAGFTVLRSAWGADAPVKWALAAILLLGSAVGVALVQARLLTRPMRGFAAGIQRFALDLRAEPIREAGPSELKRVIAAVNAMQVRIQGFVEERSLLFATISHDLRTPLTRLRLRVERGDSALTGDLLRNIDEMAAMIDTALAVFTDKTAAAQAMTPTDVGALIRLVADDWADQGVDIPVRRVGQGLATAMARPPALRRAIDNVVDNAIRYAGAVEIVLRTGGDGLLIEVNDRGPGLPPQALEQIFQPFERWGGETANPGGMGLGLASARRILEGHGGGVGAANRPGGGLQVCLSLPTTG